MKKLFTLGALLFAGTAFAQTENVGIGTAQPDKSAILDLSSSNKGFLLPRMSESQRLNIVKPAQGLQVYQTDGTAGLYVYNGKDWENASKSVAAATDPWLRGGNAVSAGEFLGTTNGEPLLFKVNNTQIGKFDASNNILLGNGAGSLISSGGFNIAIGNNSVKAVTTQTSLIGIGLSALEKATGANNVAIGGNAAANTTIGDNNLAIGTQALFANTTGTQNTAFGTFSLLNVNGAANSAIGFGSLQGGASASFNNNIGIGAGAGQNHTSGDLNVFIGAAAGQNNTSGVGNVFIGGLAGNTETGSNKLYIANSATTTPLVYGDFSAKFVTIGDVPATAAKRSDAVTSGGYNLLVKGGILTEKVKVALVTTTDWADYVFEKEYKDKMMSLEDVEKYTLIHKHLPNVPSAQEMVDKGMEVGQTSKMFMEKIEELTLYIIELNKKIKELESRK